MKRITPFLLLVIMMSLTARAQRPIEITDDSLKFGSSSSSMPGFSVIIPEARYESTMKDWVKELQSGTKSKVVEKGDELSIFGAKIKDVSGNPVNVYSQIKDMDDGVDLRVAIELEKDRFTGNAERAKAKDYLFDFAKGQYLSVANQQLDDEKKKLRDLERDLSSLERDKEKMDKSTKENRLAIAEEKERLNILNESLSGTSADQANNAGMGATDPDMVKEQEKQRKKADREIKASEKKISKAEKEIEDNQHAIPENEAQVEVARKRVSEQEAVVRQYEDKVAAIKDFRSK
jgi:hypothetical protein